MSEQSDQSQPRVYREILHPGYGQSFDVAAVLYEQRTEHQHLIIFESPAFGRVMALDGIVQTTEKDEFIYHEMLVHVPLLAHGAARRVLIIGGGDGGSAREVVKHAALEQITQVEIDAAVVELCREYLPGHSAGAFDDPRLALEIGDAADYVQHTAERYDVIVSDCTDPVGPGAALFSESFYAGCRRCLNPGGIFVAQNGVPWFQLEELVTSWRRMAPAFADRAFYAAAVPTYAGGDMAFAWGSDDPRLRLLDDDTLAGRYSAAGITTRFYSPEIHRAAFALPKYVRDALKAEPPPA